MNFQKFAKQAQKGMKQAGPPAGRSIGLIGAALGAMGLYAAASNSLFTVQPGHSAVMFSRLNGVTDNVYPPGTHFQMPWFNKAEIYDIRSKPKVIRSPTGTQDLQTVDITLRVLYHPNVDYLPQLHRELGTKYDDRVLPSIVNETLKGVVAQFNASQLITRREEVSQKIRRNLIARAKDFHLLVDDVSITHLTFGKEFSAAIEDKKVAQQEAERAKYYVQRALEDKKSKIIKAQGEAESARLIGQAVAKNPAYIELRQMETAQQIAEIMATSGNRLILDSESLLLNVTKEGGGTLLTNEARNARRNQN